MIKLLDFSSVEHFVYDILCLLRKHSFFRRGGWARGIHEGVINFLPAQKGRVCIN